MFGRRIKSALLIDFENVAQFCPPEHVANWLAWLEDGCFDSGRRRRIVERRIYWNATGLVHEDTFKRQRFDTILCERYNRLKNGLDIRITFDTAELIFHERPSLQEVIILAMDSDYVQLLKQLRKMGKRTVVLVNEDSVFAHTAFAHHADILIPVRNFITAAHYRPRTLTDKVRDYWKRAPSPLPKPQPAPDGAAIASVPPPASSPAPTQAAPIATSQSKPVPEPIQTPKSSAVPPSAAPPAPATPMTYVSEIDAVVAAVVKATMPTPNNDAQRGSIEEALAEIPGFAKNGPTAYFGAKGYLDLMQQVASRNTHIRLFNEMPKQDSVSVRFVTPGDSKAPRKKRKKIRPLVPIG